MVESLIFKVNVYDYLIVEGLIKALGILKVITPLLEATALETVRERVFPEEEQPTLVVGEGNT